ncbi:MAG: hypothetical protein AABW99_04900 [archaeon]
MAELSYDEIRRIHRLEKNTVKLVEVEPEFYNGLYSFLSQEKQDYLASLKDFSSTKARDFVNLKKMVEEIFAMREKKILNRALVSSRTKESSDEHLALQERKMFHEILSTIEKHNSLLEEIFSGGAKRSGDKKDLNKLSVKILSDIPEFVGSDMDDYGPFQKGAVVSLPVKIAKLLSERKLVEVIS